MKKIVFTLSALLSFAVLGQEEEEKIYIPEEDDWAIGIDATPFLDYFGNFIGGNDDNDAPTFNFITINQTIIGKYFVSSDMAYRGALRIGIGTGSEKRDVIDRSINPSDYPAYPNLPNTVENKMSMNALNIGLSGGVEWRKGKGRLQGYYGGELGFMVSSESTKYRYGNELTLPGASNPVFVSNADSFGTDNVTTDPWGNNARLVESRSGTSFGIGLRGFIGVEYFILPKLSLGGEFGWGLAFNSTGQSYQELESLNTSGGESVIGVVEMTGQSRTSSFGVDNDSNNTVFGPAGSLRLTFHF